ncbi:glyoxylase-like metal-dependent hydrolase (beta-lactamase superfamily II)/8-oxo-dGTP pyrophosphatase MutT (NUDIX family) [Planomicrobium stackebrandtii]|uniref:Glyoxylase-like metal-dependent hydrolase (Beta-lactamase superfamily II)/8-oxo-dGTP pyrophosphatase MutT (NUDIX family) n=1 Tax=Planomicrobium stackebrandtii TaxID=253160 RepID=A0ABU0GRW7_9BACL|nr:MBL fold metallo-hydrolase [Planomicrobium stackebrandtii]MDQ0427312.1 glyoxylase-like metal-dependent hydrolase (beta-lactamase superfamily II)/8-oxo-dGTP pyrophosphatase MutT (NUDIX family) [Planomicrobium stackebrandtii]
MIKVYEKDQVLCVEGILDKTRSKVFVYLVDGMLIDTGAEKLQEELKDFFKNYSFDQVVLTHHHEDHTGNAAWLQENRGIPLFIHPLGIERLEVDGEYPNYRKITWGNRKAFRAQPLGNQIRSRTLEWQVIHTPGHADDHVALFHEATGRLFTGDLFVSPKTRVMMKSESVPLILASLRTLLALPFQSVFCSHAGFLENGRALLEQKLKHLETLQQTITGLYAEGMHPSDIDRQLFQKTYPIVEFSNREWDTCHIVSSVVADYDIKKNRHLRPRANTLGILKRGDKILLEQQFVAHSGRDGPFYRPLGGTIELGEPSADALKREFQEEIGADVRIVRYMDVLENIYTLKQQVFHEITLVYEVEFENDHLWDFESFAVTEGSKQTTAKWVSLEELSLDETTLYPVGLLDLIQKLPEPVQPKP